MHPNPFHRWRILLEKHTGHIPYSNVWFGLSNVHVCRVHSLLQCIPRSSSVVWSQPAFEMSARQSSYSSWWSPEDPWRTGNHPSGHREQPAGLSDHDRSPEPFELSYRTSIQVNNFSKTISLVSHFVKCIFSPSATDLPCVYTVIHFLHAIFYYVSLHQYCNVTAWPLPMTYVWKNWSHKPVHIHVYYASLSLSLHMNIHMTNTHVLIPLLREKYVVV